MCAFRENLLSDVTVAVALFLLYLKLPTDGMLLVCSSELCILPRCSIIFILCGYSLSVVGCAFLYTVLFVLIGGYCPTKANIQINTQKNKQGR